MVYYPPVVETGPRQRPTTVTAATYLLYVTAALLIIFTVLSLVYLPGALRQIDSDSVFITNASSLRSGLIGGLVLRAAFAVAYVILGVFVGRGSPGARITTWVLGGLGAVCFGCALGGVGVINAQSQSLSSNVRVVHIQPRGVEDASIAVVAICLALLLLVVILLAMPASNAYFRRAEVMVVQLPYPAGPHLPDPYQGGSYQPGQYQPGQYPPGQYQPGQYQPGQYQPPGNPFEPS